MPKAKNLITEDERSRRFIETARELGVDETGKDFERAFKKIVRPKPEKQRGPKDE
jgi:hypothetical protein